MKSNFRNYFNGGKCYQWNEAGTILIISPANTELEFCLDKVGMDLLLKFKAPELSMDCNTLVVKENGINANIPVCVDKTPLFKFKEDAIDFVLNPLALTIASNFISADGKKTILTGVNVSKGGVNATDSFKAYNENLGINPDINITIPKEFIDLIKSEKGMINFKTDGKLISATVDDIEYIGVLLEGKYPDLSGIFDKAKNGEQIQAAKPELENILNYCMSSDAMITLSEYQIKIKGDNTDIKAPINLPINQTIYLMLKGLKTVLSVVTGDTLKLSITSYQSPILINDVFILLPVKGE